MTWRSTMKKSKRTLPRRLVTFCPFLILLAVFLLVLGWYSITGGVEMSVRRFEESGRQLENPNRGFYHMYTFLLEDEAVDYSSQIEQFYSWEEEPASMTMVEINLKTYRAGEISSAGLENLEALFAALSEGGRPLVVRFLYDWDGKSMETEPGSLEVILRHMEQAGEILRRHEDSIFTLQGLFIGSWGEMHDTRYDSVQDLRRLAEKLASVTGARLAVRTPAQWRQITRNGTDTVLAARLGLFNDGIMGSETDLGTYDMAAQQEQQRSRSQELEFQEELCRSVPNGGEVVVDNACNDIENAIRDLEQMRVTYLNRDYDAEVLQKWANARLSGGGCFEGMDGLTYVERRLGYRLFIGKAKLSKPLWQQRIYVEAEFRNAGFAPLYTEPEVTLTLRDEDDTLIGEYPAEHFLRDLTGGRDTGKTSAVRGIIPLEQLSKGIYQVYLDLKDPASGEPILLANTQDRSSNGYLLGEFQVLR